MGDAGRSMTTAVLEAPAWEAAIVAVGSIVASSIACTVVLAERCAVEAGTEPPTSSPTCDVDEPDVDVSHE
jgi:hypothetical protein